MEKKVVWVFIGCWAICGLVVMAAIQPPPPNIYRLKVEVEGNGTVTPDPMGELSGNIYFYITQSTNFMVDVEAHPDIGWTFDHWEIGPGIPPSATTEYTDNPHSITFTPDFPDWTAKAVFTSIAVYTVTVSAVPPEGGTVTGGGEYPEGTQVTVTAVPKPCYSFMNWTEDGTVVSTEPTYTFVVTADRDLVAHFQAKKYVITASAGPGGRISPAGEIEVACGADQTFVITPDPCYRIADVVVDGTSVGPVSSYTFEGVTSDHTIVASFEPTRYTIQASAGPGGRISPAGEIEVACGADQTFVITPDPCYRIADVVVDGNSVGPVATYTFEDVAANHRIEVSFEKLTYTLTVDVDSVGQGVIEVDRVEPPSYPATYEFECGTQVTLRAVPADGYEFVGWSGDIVGSHPVVQLIMDSDKEIMAHFQAVTGRLCVSPDPLDHDFGTLQVGESATWRFHINNCGTGVLDWSALADELWVTVSPESGSLRAGEGVTVEVKLNTAGLRPGKTYLIGLEVTSSGGEASGTLEVKIAAPCHRSHQLLGQPGWHLISLPGEVCGRCTSHGFADLCCALCHELSPCYIVIYDRSQQAYSPVSRCERIQYETGMGFWVWIQRPTDLHVELRPPRGTVAINLKKGWNLIGVPFEYPIVLSDLVIVAQGRHINLRAACADGIVGSFLFRYFPEHGYVGIPLTEGGSLLPWVGYWLYATKDCRLLIPPSRATVAEAPLTLSEEELRARGVKLPPEPPPSPR